MRDSAPSFSRSSSEIAIQSQGRAGVDSFGRSVVNCGPLAYPDPAPRLKGPFVAKMLQLIWKFSVDLGGGSRQTLRIQPACPMRKHIASLILVTALFGAVSSLMAYSVFNGDGTINVGNDALFTVTTSGNFNMLSDTFTGPSVITGNLGVGGKGSFSMSDGTFTGDLYLNRFAKPFNGPTNGHHYGATYQSHAAGDAVDLALTSAINDATSLSAAAAALPNSSNYAVTQGSWSQGQAIQISNSANNITINGAINNPFNTPVVLTISTINNSNGTLTLAGSATTRFVLNIAGDFILNNSSIVVTGGLKASNILFNLTGDSSKKFQMQQGTYATGVFDAVNRDATLSGGKIYGRLIAAQLTLTSGGQVISQ